MSVATPSVQDLGTTHEEKTEVLHSTEKQDSAVFKEDGVDTSSVSAEEENEYPDGGLRAWLVVLGVRLEYLRCSFLRPSCRQCVIMQQLGA